MSNIFRIIKLSRFLTGWILFSCFLITIQSLLQQATPLLLKNIIDELSQEVSQHSGNYHRILNLFLLILATYLLQLIVGSISQRLGDFISSRLGKNLTEIYYQRILSLSQKYFDSEISGKIINQLTRGITAIKEFVGTATNFIVPSLLQAVFGVALLSYYDPVVGLLAFSIFPVYIAISRYSTQQWGKLQLEKNVYEDRARGRIQEVVGNIKLVKTFGTQKSELGYISEQYSNLNQLYDRQSVQYHILNFVRGLGLELTIVFILFLVFNSTFSGRLSLGEMVLVIQILSQLRWPLYGMSYMLEQIQQAESDSQAFLEVLSLPTAEKLPSFRSLPIISRPSLKLSHVSFAYDNHLPVISDLSLDLNPRETVALVGHSGAGKTTLINLLLKLYEPTSGNISLSRRSYRHARHDWIRRHISLVFQDNELFSTTIWENVAYGVPNATEKQIVSALKKANAYEFVSRLPQGLDSKIGERGVKLSGGQKQRIQIARAILHNKPILILDEATSSLDSKSERLVQEALEKLYKNHLVIVIAHRFSTIQSVDRILVLDQGKIVDSGSPQELARRPGIYSELLRYQVEGNQKLLSRYEIY